MLCVHISTLLLDFRYKKMKILKIFCINTLRLYVTQEDSTSTHVLYVWGEQLHFMKSCTSTPPPFRVTSKWSDQIIKYVYILNYPLIHYAAKLRSTLTNYNNKMLLTCYLINNNNPTICMTALKGALCRMSTWWRYFCTVISQLL